MNSNQPKGSAEPSLENFKKRAFKLVERYQGGPTGFSPVPYRHIAMNLWKSFRAFKESLNSSDSGEDLEILDLLLEHEDLKPLTAPSRPGRYYFLTQSGFNALQNYLLENFLDSPENLDWAIAQHMENLVKR